MNRGEIYDARLNPVEGFHFRGRLSEEKIKQLNQALLIALDLLNLGS